MPRRGWTGPPPLLLAVTVVGFVVATVLGAGPGQASGPDDDAARLSSSSAGASQDGADDRADDGADDGSGGVTEVPAPRGKQRPTGEPATVPRQVVGLATFNAYRDSSVEETAADARALATDPGIDVIGWQESYKIGTIAGTLGQHGWDTKRFSGPAEELAVSWRRDRFSYVDSFQRLVAPGVPDEQGNYPVGQRYVVRVTLREKETGQLVSILDTHLPQAIEDLDRPGHWRPTYNAARARRQLKAMAPMWQSAPGRWTLGTGDFNLDAPAESEVEPKGGPTRAFAGRAVSSYQRLGDDLYFTHPPTARRIDYVFAGLDDVRLGRIDFLGQRTVAGLNSDHRALVVRLALT